MVQKVVIIGGGFAGAYAARHLEDAFNVTLIDTKDYFEFTPSILRTIVEPAHVNRIQAQHKQYLKKTNIVQGTVSQVTQKYVVVQQKRIPFDYLLISSGSRYNSPFKEQGLITVTRAVHLHKYYDELAKARKVLIIGGGLVGVELAAEIITKYPKKDVLIVHAHKHLLERQPQRAVTYAERWLEKHGVKIKYQERVNTRKGEEYSTNKHTRITTDLAFLCTGSTPNGDFMKAHFRDTLNEKGQILVNTQLQVVGQERMFAMGDITDRKEEKTAQNAEKQALIVVKNVHRHAKGKALMEYQSQQRAMVISLGKYAGMFTYKRTVITGLFPGLLKSFIEWKTMRNYR